jgi:metal-responsive CopG/Arc/MetJ family transcriptional regulator
MPRPGDIHVILPEGLYERLRRYAFDARVDRTEVVKRALVEYLDRQMRES